MQQIKMFKGVENNLSQLEESVNTWLRESGARVIQVTGNIAPQSHTSGSTSGLSNSPFSPSDVLVMVVYETG